VVLAIQILPAIFYADAHYLWRRTHHMTFLRTQTAESCPRANRAGRPPPRPKAQPSHAAAAKKKRCLPYRDFDWEYPPLSVLPVIPSVLLKDNVYLFAVWFGSAMAACELASLELLRRLAGPRTRSLNRYWYVVGVPLGGIAWFRLDFLSVVCATAGIVALSERRSAVGSTVAGVAAKLWPGVLAATMLVERRVRDVVKTVVGVTAVVAAWFAYSPHGFQTFLRFRRSTGFQIEGLVGSVSLLLGTKADTASNTWIVNKGQWRWVDPAMTLAWAVVVLALVVAARRRPSYDPILLTGAMVVTLLISSRLLSPQFMVWPLPFAALAWAQGERVTGWLFGIASGITLLYLFFYAQLVHGSDVWAAAVVIRNALLVALAVRMIQVGLRPRRSLA
jgi:hypothetical protein